MRGELAGAVYIFHRDVDGVWDNARDAGTWTDAGRFLNIENYHPYGELGWRVAIDAERILVSDPAAEDDADNGGMVYAP